MWLGKPDYYDEFKCIAGACGDSCCIGWEIDVDENHREVYRGAAGKLGERLRACIDWEEGHFILEGREERCPFLNEEKLCDLIIGLGEDALCHICREHPRFYDWFENYMEVGLGLCCEAAGRLILGRKKPVRLAVSWEREEDGMEEDRGETDCLKEAYGEQSLGGEDGLLFEARNLGFMILQNREKSIWQRLEIFLQFTEKLQEILDLSGLDELELFVKSCSGQLEAKQWDGLRQNRDLLQMRGRAEAYNGLISICRELEPIDESWPKTLDMLAKLVNPQGYPEVGLEALENAMLDVSKEREYEYEQLAVYFVYRYFMKCREDEDVRSKGKLAVFCILLIRLLDVARFAQTGSITTEDRVQNAKCCSKEVEYSEENLEMLADAFWERDEVSLENLHILLNAGYRKN